MGKIENILSNKPFNLNQEDINWVIETKGQMSLEEKVGQLFCACARSGDKEELEEIFSILNPGGIMYRPMDFEVAIDYKKMIDERTKYPLLISANVEKGGNGAATQGTLLGSPLEVAATDDVDMAYKLGTVCAKEGTAVGVNWAFAPIIDIDYNFRNPITNTRTFGNEPKRVKDMGVAYVKAVQENGMAASIKHFPGDGCDERDQHLVTSINDLSCEEWDKTFGAAYQASIDEGALTVMIGHIMQPAYQKKLNPALKDEDLLPATLSKELMVDLLREQLGFNGVISTDATTMCGFAIPMSREKAVPASVAAGADVFLFTKNLAEDYKFMLAGVEDGTITAERLDEAVTRILALKATLKLHVEGEPLSVEKAKEVVGCKEHIDWTKECADKAITLVKEQSGVLPISPDKHKRILFYPIESEEGFVYTVKAGVCTSFKERLEKEGFEVTIFEPNSAWEGNMTPYKEMVDSYDLIIYMANMATKSNQTAVRIEWAQPMGANVPIYIEDVPTIFISVENPYHLLDVPRVKTFINTYCSTDYVLDALLEKMVGRSEFKGKSPVDAFCGKWDARL